MLRVCYLPAQNNHAWVYQMNDVCKGYSEIRMYIESDFMRDFVPLGRQSKHLFCCNTFGSCSCYITNGIFRLRIFYRKSNHRTRDCLRRCNGFEMSIATARTLWAILFDKHVPNFACCAGLPMIDLAIDQQSSADTTSQANIEYDPL